MKHERLISIFLTSALCLGMCPAALAAGKFDDVPAEAWYAGDVSRAAELGLLQGKGENQFAPLDLLTGAEALTLAVRLYRAMINDSPIPEALPEEPWYGPYYRFAVEHGITSPDSLGPEFHTNYASRLLYVNLFYHALNSEILAPINQVTDNAIPDVPVTDGLSEAVYAFYRAGIIQGSDAHGHFNPESYISRAEVAAILVRIMDESVRKHFNLGRGLDQIRSVAASEGAQCAVAYLGYANGMTTSEFLASDLTIQLYQENLEFPMETLPVAEQPGDEIYLLIPTDPDSGVKVAEWLIGQEGIGAAGELLYSAGTGAPFLVRGNISDIMPNLLVIITDSQGNTLSYHPCLSLKDGALWTPETGVYDYTIYGEG